MGTLYIDYTRSIIRNTSSNGSNKVNGGANYTRTLIGHLKRYIEEQKIENEIVIIVPNEYQFESEYEKTLFASPIFKILPINKDIDSIEYEIDSTLFIPLLSVKEYPLLKKIKADNQVRIALTIHGLRNLDLYFDKYDLTYFDKGSERVKQLLNEVSFPIKRAGYRAVIAKYTKYADTIITVSNYSLAGLAKYGNLNNILLQYQDTLPIEEECPVELPERDFALFVSGNRTEKNLSRSLVAFKQYIEKYNRDMNLVIVGTNKKISKLLTKATEIQELVEKKQIIFLDYISDEQLVWLYRRARFLLYTSKSEGFGLPALEAAKQGCPTLAAYGTSIPEVLGPYCIYVNPYSVEKIVAGLRIIDNEKTRKYYSDALKKEYISLKEKSVFSTEMVIHELIK